MKPKDYRVEKYENSIHLEPKQKSVEEAAASLKPKKKSCKTDVFEWENGKIDIMFKDQNKTQPPTLTVVTKFPFCTLMQSSGRFNLYFSFAKEETKLFEREMLLNSHYWVETMYAAIESQRLGESNEQLQERINEIKQKGDFV